MGRHPKTKAMRLVIDSLHKNKKDFFGRPYNIQDKYTPDNRNLVYCLGSYKEKLQFESEEKAVRYISYNSDRITAEKGYAPTRAYYCNSCCCWHVTSKPLRKNNTSTRNCCGKKQKTVVE